MSFSMTSTVCLFLFSHGCWNWLNIQSWLQKIKSCWQSLSLNTKLRSPTLTRVPIAIFLQQLTSREISTRGFSTSETSRVSVRILRATVVTVRNSIVIDQWLWWTRLHFLKSIDSTCIIIHEYHSNLLWYCGQPEPVLLWKYHLCILLWNYDIILL